MNSLVRQIASMGLGKGPLCSPARAVTQLGSIIPTTSSRSSSASWHYVGSSVYCTPNYETRQSMLFSTDVSSEVTPPSNASTVFTDEASGQQYGVVLDTRKLPKLKPGIVQKRLAACKTYVGRESTIRQSPWKLNRVCQLVAGLTLEEALTQLKFCDVKNADLVAKVLKRTSNLADIRHGIQMSQLEVAECFATKSMMLRRMKPMGRGRAGVLHHKFSNVRVVLREIDFPLRIYQQKSLNQKKKWLRHQHRAEQDATAAKAKREELRRLEKQQEEQLMERKAAQKS